MNMNLASWIGQDLIYKPVLEIDLRRVYMNTVFNVMEATGLFRLPSSYTAAFGGISPGNSSRFNRFTYCIDIRKAF